MTEAIDLVREFGVTVALLLFFVWRDFTREKRLSARIDELENFQKDRLETLAVDVTSALKENTSTMRSFCFALSSRPCLAGKAEELVQVRDNGHGG